MAPYSSQIASSRLLAVTDRCTCLVCVHAVLVVLLCSSLLYLLMQHTRSKRIVYAVQIFAALYIPFTGLYLVHLGRHWASDVGGGYLYGLLYLVVAIKLFHLGRAWEARHPDLLTMATVRCLSASLVRIAAGAASLQR